MEQWTIYCHTHNESGRKYVGLTKKTMLERWNNHIYFANSAKNDGRSHFANAIRKYGRDAFSHEILETCRSLAKANKAEKKWIRRLRLTNPNFGFNLTPGGSHTPTSKINIWEDPAKREKLSRSLKRKWQDPEFRARSIKAHREASDRHVLMKKYNSKNGIYLSVQDIQNHIRNMANSVILMNCNLHGDITKCEVYISHRKYRDSFRIEYRCKHCVLKKQKCSYEIRKELILAHNKNNRDKNKDKMRIYNENYRKENRDILLAKKREYHHKNREVLNAKAMLNYRKRVANKRAIESGLIDLSQDRILAASKQISLTVDDMI